MDYTDKGKSFDKIRKENYKTDLERYGVEFFKFPVCKAFSLASEAHYHEAIECIIMNRGTITVFNDGKWEKVSKGEMVIFRSMGVHSIFTDDEDVNDYYVLKIVPSLLYGVSHISNDFPLRFSVYNPNLKTIWKKEEIENSSISYGLNRLIGQLDRDGKSTATDHYIVVSALLVLDGIFESAATKELVNSSSIIFKAVAYITTNFEQNLTITEVAHRHGLSPSHFAKEFKRTVGKSFKDYLISVRMDHAEILLRSTSLTVSDIASKCGYPSYSHFISSYKNQKGITPLQVRKNKE